MDKLVSALQLIIASIQANFIFTLSLVAILWFFNIINYLLRYRLNVLGIVPRTTHGLIGIIFCPLLHGDFNHLFFNTVPLFVLANLVLLKGHNIFYLVSAAIIVLSGFAIWLLGRRAIHVGASSLIMGYFGYLLAEAYYRLDAVTIIVAILCIYYFGGLLLALIPSGRKGISWEGHVFGFLAGVAVAYLI